MKRVFMLIGIAFFVLLFAVERTCLAEAGKPIELKLSHFMSPMHNLHGDVFAPFAKEVEEKSKGLIKITIFPGEALGKARDQFDMATTGVTDFAFVIPAYTPGRFPLSSVMELPFLVPSSKVGSRVAWELATKGYFKGEFLGAKLLSCWTTGPGQIYMNKKLAKNLDDIKGMRLRSPGPLQTALLRELGISPLTLPIPELYEALQRGMADGAIAPLSTIVDFKLYEVVKNFTIANIYTTTMCFVGNEKVWNSLSPGLQKIVEDAAGAKISAAAGTSYDAYDLKGIEAGKKANAQIYILPQDERKRWVDKTKGLND
ncbi:MAG: TRAP transporter substrate-binding protein, partial [Nitrospirota bacterium]|nr:TRAP transporter substrate-binding protein [Nitrospirota bacterium]